VGINFIGSGAGEERVQWRGAAGSYGAFMVFNAAVSVGEAIGQHHFFGRGRVEAVPTARFPGLGGSGSRSSMQPASGGSAACLGACLEEEERVTCWCWAKGRVGLLLPREEKEKWVGLLWMFGQMQRD
jgi:hypothetical protein